MRVITGKAKGLKLNTIEGIETRPTLDRIKVTMFDLIGDNFYETKCLDIFSGSGALGIEALSRGASECTFVDSSTVCCDVIRQNLEHTKLTNLAMVCNSDVYKALEMFTNEKKFDIIFMDPPYDKGYLNKTIEKIIEMDILSDEGMIVAECASYEKIDNANVCILKERVYNKMAIYLLGKKKIGG